MRIGKYINKLDWYIIKKFLGTYLFTILLIISIAVVFDFNEKLDNFIKTDAPINKIIFEYYINFIPYFANLFSPLFVFVAVIFFTSKMAENSEIIAMFSAGLSFRRMMRPYMISAAIISLTAFLLNAFIIPKGSVERLEFEHQYVKPRKNNYASNVQMEIDKGVIAYIDYFSAESNIGSRFLLDKFEDKKLVSHLTARRIVYNPDTMYKWTIHDYMIREMHGMKETIIRGEKLDTILKMDPSDFLVMQKQQEMFTSPELSSYISRQRERGVGNVESFEIEYHKRIAISFASFILTIIGVSLSSRKRKGGMGLYLGIGLALSFSYILFQTVSASFAVNGDTPPIVAVWIPNILYSFIAYYLYKKAPR